VVIDSRGQKSGPASEVPLTPGTDSYSPSISRDGRWLAYVEDTPGKSNNVVLTDLKSGKNHTLDEASRRSNYGVGIAPDGSKVSFEQDCDNRRWQSGDPVNCGFAGSADGERPMKVCESCIPKGFSADNSVRLVRKYNPIRDDKPPEWIAVTDGTHNDSGPQFSPDGNTAYFISQRDGYHCIWAQRLEPATKRPLDKAFGYEHFHDASQKDLDGFWGGDGDLSIARDKIIVSLVQWDVGIWMTQIE
jgi:Tol biopolymer transport system component